MDKQLQILEAAAIDYATTTLGLSKDKGFNVNVQNTIQSDPRADMVQGFVMTVTEAVQDTVPPLMNSDYSPECETVIHTSFVDDE